MKKSNTLKRHTRDALTLTDVLQAKEIIITDAQDMPYLYRGIDELKHKWRIKHGQSDTELYRHLHELIKKQRVWVKV